MQLNDWRDHNRRLGDCKTTAWRTGCTINGKLSDWTCSRPLPQTTAVKEFHRVLVISTFYFVECSEEYSCSIGANDYFLSNKIVDCFHCCFCFLGVNYFLFLRQGAAILQIPGALSYKTRAAESVAHCGTLQLHPRSLYFSLSRLSTTKGVYCCKDSVNPLYYM